MGVDLKNDRSLSRWMETQNFTERMDKLRRAAELKPLAQEKLAFGCYGDMTLNETRALLDIEPNA